MKTFTIEIEGRQIPVYVDNPTKLMAIRFEVDGSSKFEAGCDFHYGLWITNVGIYGYTIEEVVKNYINYRKPKLSHIKHIYVCDDMPMLDMPSEPVDGKISYHEVEEVESIK